MKKNRWSFIRSQRGITLLELLAAIAIGAMIIGVITYCTIQVLRLNQYSSRYNSAKSTIVHISNTIMEKMERTKDVDVVLGAGGSMTLELNTDADGTDEEFFYFTRNAGDSDLYDVRYRNETGTLDLVLGTVGFLWEGGPAAAVNNRTYGFNFTFWLPYTNTQGAQRNYIITYGYHTLVE